MQYFGISRFGADHEDEEIFKLEALLQMQTKDRLRDVSSILQLAGTLSLSISMNITRKLDVCYVRVAYSSFDGFSYIC
jgi:hypothetical protein